MLKTPIMIRRIMLEEPKKQWHDSIGKSAKQ
jgi:hypothetical protein